MRCDHPLTQEDAVRLCKKGLKPEINEKLIGANVKTFDHMNGTISEIKMFFADNPTLTPGKNKVPEKRTGVSKEVHAVDFTPAVPKIGGRNNGAASYSQQ